jgi:Rhs element Vgr protein
MPDTQTLPIPVEHRELIVSVDGERLPGEIQLLGASIRQAANRIGSARLIFLDGVAADVDFPLSGSDRLLPGSAVEVFAGANAQPASLFRGIIVSQAIQVRERGARLIIECRHAAVRMTLAPRDATFVELPDADILSTLFSHANVSIDVEGGDEVREQIVQCRTTDWDFALQRARASGLVLFALDDGMVAKVPALGEPVCVLQYGATLLELDAELDARTQFGEVVGVGWDPAEQATVESPAEPPAITGPGDLTNDTLASAVGSERLELRHTAGLGAEAAAAATSRWMRSRLDKVRGRCRCEGIASVRAGDTVTLAGLGTRFNGDVLVTGIRHEFDVPSGWKTELLFGTVEDERRTLGAPAASPAFGRIEGLQVGVVLSNEDPSGEMRVQVRIPMISSEGDGIWARLASPDAGDGRGLFLRPEVGDEVILGFLDGDAQAPVVLGLVHSSARPAPLSPSDANPQKGYVSREGVQVIIDDEAKSIAVQTPAGFSVTVSDESKSITLATAGGNSLSLSDDQQGITLADQNGNSITLGSDGISIESSKALTLKAGTEASVEGGTSMSAKGATELKLEGGSSAELSSSGVTKVKGSLVQIN